MKVGDYNVLEVRRQTQNGVYLGDADGEVLLPKRYVSDDLNVGDSLEVFVYTDSEDRKVATTLRPSLVVGGIASLKVADVSRYGAFMEWNLPKDLFVPFSNQAIRMQKGEKYPVTAYLDEKTGRIVGSSKIAHLVSNADITVTEGDEVDVIVARRLERGFRVIVNSKHWGMLYDNQVYVPVALGDTLKAWVTKVTEDRRVDVSLSRPGFSGVLVAVESLKNLFIENGGELKVGDKSDPEQIKIQTGMSKKNFKKALGVLFKEGVVEPSDYSCRQIKPF